MIKDLNPLTTPNDVLVDALNATIITYNGNEFVLQNDQGNCKVERAKLPTGFIPIGMKEYGGIIYVAAFNPETKMCEVGSFPSPERDFSTRDFDGLAPSNFKNTDFIVPLTPSSTEKLIKISKLFEPELFKLSPGDKYVITYTINDIDTGSSLPNEIDNNTKFNNFISKDLLSRKLLRLKFYKITDNNNLAELDSQTVNVIENQPDIEEFYTFFKENSQATIAVAIEVEPLDLFQTNVIDISRRTDTNKKIAIESIGYSNSMSDFEGIRVDVELPTPETFYVQKTSTNRKVSVIVDELLENSIYKCSIIPYSKYNLFPKLKQDFQIQLGQFASSGSGVNDIYRYFTDSNFIKLDFDFKFQGNNSNGLHLYVEMYDAWSDYSVIKTVDNPTYYGINSVIFELVDEPAVDVFNSTTTGGTLNTNLITNLDTTLNKTLLNSTNLIRKDTSLRRNHFYIVRISGVDIDTSQPTISYTHYDLYKGLYSNSMFNANYILQPNDPIYEADFNQLDYELNSVKYSGNLLLNSTINVPVIIDSVGDELKTNSKYYKISADTLDITDGYTYDKQYQTIKNYDLSLTLQGTDGVFGDFNTDLVTVELPDLTSSVSPTGDKPVILDNGWNLDADTDPESVGDWEITNISGNNYTLSTKLVTNRKIKASADSTTDNIFDYAEISLLPSFYYRPNGDSTLSNANAAIQLTKYRVDIKRVNNSVINYSPPSGSIDDGYLRDRIIESGINTGRPFSAILLTAPESTYHFDHPNYGCTKLTTDFWKVSTMLMRQGDAWRLTKVHSLSTMIDFFTNLKVASNVAKVANVYYPDTNNIKFNGQVESKSIYPTLDITTKFTPIGVKSYLSTIRFKALNSIEQFQTSIINDYIASRVSTSTIVDNKLTIRDGFIPFITSEVSIVDKITVPEIVISQASDSVIVNQMIAGNNQYNTDPLLSPGLREHGALFTSKPENYAQYLPKLKLFGVVPGVSVNVNDVYVDASNATGNIVGYWARVGRCDRDDNSPDLITDIDFTS